MATETVDEVLEQPHGPGHLGCPTCNTASGQSTTGRAGLSAIKLSARGEEFRIVQLQGQIFVCTQQNGSCCCGWAEKGRMPFDPTTLWGDEWERRRIRNRVHLTFTGCLGPCAVGNNALIQLLGRSIWFKDLNHPSLAVAVFDYVEAMLAEGRILAPPEPLRGHVYNRYTAPTGDAFGPLVEVQPEATDGPESLDPVCLMDVDPTSARHTAEYGGRTYVFCAPACRKQFLADPVAYVGA